MIPTPGCSLLCSRVESTSKKARLRLFPLLAAAAVLLLAPCARAQSQTGGSSAGSPVISAGGAENHYTWVESFNGSSNTDGQVTLLDSSVGYMFDRRLLFDGGLPVYFVRATTITNSGASTTNSFTALGDLYGQVRLSFPNPLLNFKTQLTGRAPTGSTSDGISTGHATYDWTNRIDRGFGNWMPFFEFGLADSIPDAFVYGRPFASYGNLAHFQLGASYHVIDRLGVAASAFDVAPWGTQDIRSRVAGNEGGASGGHGPPFFQNPQTTGGASLAADNGFSVGGDLAATRALDFTVGYSRSTHYDLNTVSFGVTVNMRKILRVPSL